MKSEYPKTLTHPHHQPAKLSMMAAMDMPGGSAQGQPEKWAPVVVNNADQEAYYQSRGYQSGGAPTEKPLPLAEQRFKDRENIRVRTPAEPEPTETHEFPKYVGEKIANTPEEEEAILAEMGASKPVEVVDLSEYEKSGAFTKGELIAAIDELLRSGVGIDFAEFDEFRAWKANKERLQQLARGSTKNEPVKRKRHLSEEQRQVLRDRMAKARAAKNTRTHQEDAETNP